MKKNYFIILAILVIALAAVLLIYTLNQNDDANLISVENLTEEQSAKDEALYLGGLTEERRTIIYNYLNDNILSLSPEAAFLGGNWYLTEINFTDSNRAEISYEDGHVFRKAIVFFSFSDLGDPIINDFVMIPEEAPVFDNGAPANGASVSGSAEVDSVNILPDNSFELDNIPAVEPSF